MVIAENIGLLQSKALKAVIVPPSLPLRVVSTHPDEQTESEEEDGAASGGVKTVEDVL